MKIFRPVASWGVGSPKMMCQTFSGGTNFCDRNFEKISVRGMQGRGGPPSVSGFRFRASHPGVRIEGTGWVRGQAGRRLVPGAGLGAGRQWGRRWRSEQGGRVKAGVVGVGGSPGADRGAGYHLRMRQASPMGRSLLG
jgi:hypothetical protein